MFHLLINSSPDRWRTTTGTIPVDRCLRSFECTPAHLIDQYCQFTREQNSLLTQLPAVFGYESILKQDARLGQILAISKVGGNVRLDFQLLDSYPPIPNDVLDRFSLQLGIEDIELHRGHWVGRRFSCGMGNLDRIGVKILLRPS